ncbi:MAG: AsmA family protein [Xanthobacteraceae bacterium]
MAQGIRRLGTPIAACLGVAAIGLIALSWLIDRDAVRRSVEDQLRAATGLDLVAEGDAEVSLFPGSFVTLRNVVLKSDGEPALSVEAIKSNLRLVPLLMRRFEIADVTLVRPRVDVAPRAAGGSNWTPLIAELVHSVKPGVNTSLSFSEVKIQDGTLTYHDDNHNIVESVTGANMSLAWPSITRSFAATGEFDWHGARVDGSLSMSDFVAALAGERSGVKARIASAPLKFAFDGAVANGASLMLDGTLTAEAASLREALRWSGHQLPGSTGFGRFALKAKATVVGTAVALANVNMEIDGNVTEGVLSYNSEPRQSLQATLASDTLDIAPYVETVRLLASGAHDWSRQTFDLKSLSTTDLDIRLSAAKVTAGPTRFGRTAVGANLRNGKLALSIGEAQVFGGILRGSFGLANAATTSDLTAQFQLTDIDLEAFGAELFGNRRLAGRGTLNGSLQASGSSPFELAQSLDGTVKLTGHDGALVGFDVAQLLKRLERRPLSGTGEFRNGRTPFNTLDVALKFDRGIASTDDARVEGPAARLTLSGTANVPGREYDLKGIASLIAAPDAPPAFELPFVIQGPWDDPLVLPDSDALIRRSPASAPLLDAVRDNRTRDAVRSVIDRFKGAPKPAPAAAPQPAATEAPGLAPAASAN